MGRMVQIEEIGGVVARIKRQAEAQMKLEIERTEKAYLAGALLAAEGFDLKLGRYDSQWPMLTVEKKDLPRVYKALGKMALVGKNVEDTKTRTIRVQLQPVAFDNVTICYSTKLPRGGKCKIVKVTEKSSRCTRATLVCGI